MAVDHEPLTTLKELVKMRESRQTKGTLVDDPGLFAK